MSQVLTNKILASLQTETEIAGLVFIFRRPRIVEVEELHGKRPPILDFLKKYIIGWRDIKESDLINGGVPKLVEFDSDTFCAWVADRPDIYRPLVERVINEFEQYAQQQADTLKKPDAG